MVLLVAPAVASQLHWGWVVSGAVCRQEQHSSNRQPAVLPPEQKQQGPSHGRHWQAARGEVCTAALVAMHAPVALRAPTQACWHGHVDLCLHGRSQLHAQWWRSKQPAGMPAPPHWAGHSRCGCSSITWPCSSTQTRVACATASHGHHVWQACSGAFRHTTRASKPQVFCWLDTGAFAEMQVKRCKSLSCGGLCCILHFHHS